MKKWFDIKAAAGGEKQTDILIFDEIGLWGITAKDFATALKAIPEDHAITVRINSPGGSVFDGYAIFNALKSRASQITTKIEGLAASMASVIALAGSKVTAAANSIVMIHNPWSGVAGDSDDLRKMADLLDKLAGQLVGIYSAKTGLPEDDVRAAMDAETWFTATEAKEWGLIDEITDEIQVAASFDVSRFRNAPQSLPMQKTEEQPNEAAALSDQLAAITAERDTLKQHAENSAAQIAALKVEADQALNAIKAEKEAHAATVSELTSILAENAKRDAESFISSAIASGKINDSASEKFVEMFIADPEGARAVIDALQAPVGNSPVARESKYELADSDAQIFATYSKIEDQSERIKFLKAHESSIWRHQSRK